MTLSQIARTLTFFFAAAGLLPAQTTTYSLSVGTAGGYDCQSGAATPALTGGVVATGTIDFTYDAGSHLLIVDVANTSPVVAGETNPLITTIAFNLPHGAVTGATLVAQSAAGGAAPAFALVFDADRSAAPDTVAVACFGAFNVGLVRPSIQGGIANAAAPLLPAPPGQAVVGPARFEIQLSGPGADFISAQAIATGVSQHAPAHAVNAAFKFQGGGPNGEESGFVSSAVSGCVPAVWMNSSARIGSRFELCAAATPGCRGCLLVSGTPGPVIVGKLVVPIGLPILLEIALPAPPAGTSCFPITVPDDPSLIGATLYLAYATMASPVSPIEFSPALTLTFVP